MPDLRSILKTRIPGLPRRRPRGKRESLPLATTHPVRAIVALIAMWVLYQLGLAVIIFLPLLIAKNKHPNLPLATAPTTCSGIILRPRPLSIFTSSSPSPSGSCSSSPPPVGSAPAASRASPMFSFKIRYSLFGFRICPLFHHQHPQRQIRLRKLKPIACA